MEYILKIRELEKYFEKADVIDVKVFEGETTLRKFIASMLYSLERKTLISSGFGPGS